MQHLNINIGLHAERANFFCQFSGIDMLSGNNYIENAPRQLIFSLLYEVADEPLLANNEMATLHQKAIDDNGFFNEDIFMALLHEKYADNDNIIYFNLAHGGAGPMQENLIFIFNTLL
jgi:hypothetical protein